MSLFCASIKRSFLIDGKSVSRVVLTKFCHKQKFTCSKLSAVAFNTLPTRCIHGTSFKLTEKLEEEKPKDVDIGKGTWKEVYKGVLTTQIKLVKMFSLGTSLVGLSVQPILYEKLATTNVGLFVGFASFLGFFTFVTPALIHFISKKYVTKLEYDPQKNVYAATTLSFFLREKKLEFKADDVIRPEVPGVFTSFKVNGKALFVDPDTFENIEHYGKLMGYDKEYDLKKAVDEIPK